jgi:uncharacterized membrane protein YhaH (DUF805 family)
MEWATLPLKRYLDFAGRSRRKEYWMFFLLVIVLEVVAMVLDNVLGMGQMVAGIYGPLLVLLMLALIVPGIAVSIRRLHDTDRSAWWVLIGLVPFVGGLVLLVFFVMEGTRGPNRFGPDPKVGEAVAAI